MLLTIKIILSILFCGLGVMMRLGDISVKHRPETDRNIFLRCLAFALMLSPIIVFFAFLPLDLWF